MKKVDFLIAGQGIAGTVFSYLAMKAGYSVHVADVALPGMSSKVAGGLINPITGRFMKKSWMAETLFPCLNEVYKDMDALLGIESFQAMPILRLLENEEEQKRWEEKRLLSDHQPFMSASSAFEHPGLLPHHAAAYILQGGWLDTGLLLKHWRDYLIKQNTFSELQVLPSDIAKGRWNEIEFRHLIFCEGYHGHYNPFFPGIPLNPAKGELLLVEIPQAEWHFVINKHLLIIPLGNQLYKVGATVEHTDDLQLLDTSLEELETKLKSIVAYPYHIRDRLVGIRPTVRDRRPVLGASTAMEGVWMLNGLGTKGVALAPYMAKHLLQHIVSKAPLMQEVNWKRFVR
ncbi:MAG: FAD-binding oxidoreductase [Bacteroidetes bacterium]|nr:FAD-binding oxidoreductase [Bacteroidota bacterium]